MSSLTDDAVNDTNITSATQTIGRSSPLSDMTTPSSDVTTALSDMTTHSNSGSTTNSETRTCNLLVSLTTSDHTTCNDDHTSLVAISQVLNTLRIKIKLVLTDLYQLYPHVKDVPAIDTVFIQARSFVVKIYSLAEYISDEERYVITAVEENDRESYVDFLKEVSSKISSCRKDFESLKESLKSDVKPKLLVLDSNKGNIGTAVAVTGGVTAGAGIGSVALGFQSILLLPVGLLVGASLVTAGAVTAYKGHNIYQDSKKKEKCHELTVLLFENLEANIDIIDSDFNSTIACIDSTNEILAFSNKEKFTNNLRNVKKYCEQLMEYTGRLKEQETLDDFILMCSYDDLY